MKAASATELILIRHAPALNDGRLCGRTDVAADVTDGARLRAVAAEVGVPAHLIVSPALRCRQTATTLWPGVDARPDARLWEQDFGAWDGFAFADLPDLGPLPAAQLAAHRPPGGESFADLCARVAPALQDMSAPDSTVIVAHAGTVRAALACALDSIPAALAFEVMPLSVTRLLRLRSGQWVIGMVNWQPTGPG